ncbi:hypothetical protein A1O1_01266 [Capronia coronata CBS 617.96]|uniref:AB hydrolase-1 domain-containing protein n=1 Tax=Capronia coronata CBS 617.96 TaxID=1182541 RepID=W9Z2F5_9EURO|nr:uncharacterized protein A1O1_01266 [Capronia coronata CBS 617.96]EXJ96140.1 hypothetical protein A1O1_01266 [Capronia coronata CBS 617.96]
MSLPKANFSFIIPSIHDDLELKCRLYYPRRTEQNAAQLFGKAFAIMAHPYAPLGGSYDDPVVGMAGSVLLQNGCFLVTFNFRGASGSAGRTSWSGKAELADYVSVYGFVLCYIDAICRTAPGDGRVSTKESPLLILGGYSYGAMITSHLPPVDVVASLFESLIPGSAQSEIKLRAMDLSRDGTAYVDLYMSRMTLSLPGIRGDPGEDVKKSRLGVTVGGYESDAASRRASRESTRKSIDGERVRQSIERVRRKIHPRGGRSPDSETERHRTESAGLLVPAVAYVLISPLLPPVAGFTTMFSKLQFTRKGREIDTPQEEYHELTAHPCCCLFGSRDVFTSDRKLQRWAADLSSRPGSQFTAVRVDTGHFWHEDEGSVQLRQGLAEWLKKLTPKSLSKDAQGPEKSSQSTSNDGI